MSYGKVHRCESHALSTTPALRQDVERTIFVFRRAVRLLATVALTRWPTLGPLNSKDRLTALESLFHATALNPSPKYRTLDKVLGKMPSYLRRAAVNAACGVVSSYLSNYDNWLIDVERERGTRPPRLGFSNVFPSLYGGNMIEVGIESAARQVKAAKLVKDRTTFDEKFFGPLHPDEVARRAKRAAKVAAGLPPSTKLADTTPFGYVRLKLLSAKGLWQFSEPLKLHGRRLRLPLDGAMPLAPTLMQRGAKVWLACPVEFKKPHLTKHVDVRRVCSVDVGINTAAALSVVDTTGTVIARKFLTCGRHNDRRDALSTQISGKQTKTRGFTGGHAGPGFCRTLFRRIAGLNVQAARELASGVIAFALAHQAQAIVVEDLKGFRPRGRSAKQRKRFHRFQHRMLLSYLKLKAEELGLRLIEVYARGTSRWAYDGSGVVVRSKTNAALATFANGRQYNADLNAAYNIAARGIARLLKLEKAYPGKNPADAVRMPLVLADIWAHARGLSHSTLTAARDSVGAHVGSAEAPTTARSV